MLAGLYSLLSRSNSYDTLSIRLGGILLAAAVIAFIAALSRHQKQVQFAYHEMHALAMVVYGVSLLLFCTTLDRLVTFTAFLFIFYTFSELIFCSWIFNLKQKVDFRILFVRVLLGFGIGIGTVVSLSFTEYTLPIFGSLFIAIGINIVCYVPIIKEKEKQELAFSINEPST